MFSPSDNQDSSNPGSGGLWHHIFYHHQYMMILIDAPGNIVEWNQATLDTLGFTSEEMRHLHVWDCDEAMSEEMWSTFTRYFDANNGVGTFKVSPMGKKKVPLNAEMTLQKICFAGDTYFFAIAKPINTKDVETQQSLLSPEALLDNIPHMAWLKDTNARYLAVNETFCEFVKLSKQDVIGRTVFEIWPNDLAENLHQKALSVLTSGERYQGEEMVTAPDGDSVWSEICITPLQDPKHHILLGTVGIARDISDRKADEFSLIKAHQEMAQLNELLREELVERRMLEIQLVQSQKMESIGHLAAGIAHEINNPLGYVYSNIETLYHYVDTLKHLLEIHIPLTTEYNAERVAQIQEETNQANLSFIFEDLEGIFADSREGLNRTKEIVQALKQFARPEEDALQWVNVNELIDSTLKFAAGKIQDGCVVETDFDELPLVPCHPSEINQVLLNVLVNAAQACGDHGRIVIKTRHSQSDDLFGARQVLISIADNGVGIPAENLESIFNPFFTTRLVGEGSGLGLAVSYGIIKKHNGSIEVDSTEGEGSTFTIRLPSGEESEPSLENDFIALLPPDD